MPLKDTPTVHQSRWIYYWDTKSIYTSHNSMSGPFLAYCISIWEYCTLIPSMHQTYYFDCTLYGHNYVLLMYWNMEARKSDRPSFINSMAILVATACCAKACTHNLDFMNNCKM